MPEMLMRLSSDQRSKALSTWFSAAETSSGNVLVRMLSQRSRMRLPRWIKASPCATDLRSSAMRVERSFQPATSGVKTSLSAMNRPMPTAARMVSSCWRFLVVTGASWSPLEIEGELQRRLAAQLIDLDVADLLGGPELVEHVQKRLVVPGGAGAGDRGRIADLQGAGRDHARFGERFGHAAKDAKRAERVIEPGAVTADLRLHPVEFGDLGGHLLPARAQAGELPLLVEHRGQDQGGDGAGGRADGAHLAGREPGGELLPGGDLGREKL